MALDTDVEIGGSDQTVNMLVGRELLAHRGKEKFVLTTKLLVDPTGKKMGKTEGNLVALDDESTEMYGKVMSWPDSLIPLAFEIATPVPLPEVVQINHDLAAGKNPKIFKMLLAYKLVELYHGKTAAIAAEEQFKRVFERHELPADLPTVAAAGQILRDVLVAAQLASSRGEARRLIAHGGVKVNGSVVKEEIFVVTAGAVVQKGKRFFVRVF